MERTRCAPLLAALALALAAAPLDAQQVLPPPLAAGPPSDVPIALQIARWHMLDGDIDIENFEEVVMRKRRLFRDRDA